MTGCRGTTKTAGFLGYIGGITDLTECRRPRGDCAI